MSISGERRERFKDLHVVDEEKLRNWLAQVSQIERAPVLNMSFGQAIDELVSIEQLESLVSSGAVPSCGLVKEKPSRFTHGWVDVPLSHWAEVTIDRTSFGGSVNPDPSCARKNKPFDPHRTTVCKDGVAYCYLRLNRQQLEEALNA